MNIRENSGITLTTLVVTIEGNIASKFTAVNAKNETEDEQAQTTLNNANILSAEL